jgi:ABC-2 type transport system permease protein
VRPGPLRQVRLVLGLGVRRWINRIASGAAAKRSAKDGGAVVVRPPTPRRRLGVGALMLVAVLGILFQVIFSTWRFADRAVAVVEHRPPVHVGTWRAVQSEVEAGKDGWQDRVRKRLADDRELQGLAEEERSRLIDAAIVRLQEDGAAADDPAQRAQVARLTAFFFAFVALCIVALSLGMSNVDLARPDWDELWLAAQPVPDRVLFSARLAQYVLLNALAWLLVPAAIVVLAVTFGMRIAPAIGLGLASGLIWAVTASALRLAAETWLRQRLAHARIKNLQAICTVVGMAAMVGLYAVGMGMGPLPAWFVHGAALLPWDALPTGWAAVAALQPERILVLLPLGLAIAAVAAIAAVRQCAAWSRGGLLVHDGTMTAGRGGKPAAWRAMHVLGKDLTLLRRDRALLVQSLIMPLFMIALQLTLNPELGRAAVSGFHAAATFVVALGGWVLMSATAALAAEGQALWILAGAPMPLATALRGKVVMWASFATAYALLALIVVVICLPWPGPAAIADMAMILAGMPLLAALAVGIGAAATDPQTTVPNRRVGVGSVYLYMMVMGLFSLTVNQGGTHQRLAMLVLLAVIAWALWQRLRDRLAYLFEPVDRPPRQVDLADGAWAAFAFLVLQGLIVALMLFAGCEPGLATMLAFGLAGITTASFTVLALWRAQVPDLLRAVGLRPAPGFPLLRTLSAGIGCGLLAAVAMIGYMAALTVVTPYLPMLQETMDAARLQPEVFAGWKLVVLAVVLAPLCEEFIFRGLLFRGLRRDLSLPWAAVASAAVFAIIHPSLGVIPVFGLGLACAIAYERGGWLLAPILAHATYNGVVVLLAT